MPLPDPLSFHGQFDWLLLADPADLPARAHEGTALHLYLDRPILEAHAATLAILPDDPARLGSAQWQAARLEEERTYPSMEMAAILRAYDRAAQSYSSEPPFLIQVRRLQMRIAVALQELGMLPQLSAPPLADCGLDTYALFVSNGHLGRHEMLAPVAQLSRPLFEAVQQRAPAFLFADYDADASYTSAELGVVRLALQEAPVSGVDPLTVAALAVARLAVEAAMEFGWILDAEGPEPVDEDDFSPDPDAVSPFEP